MDGVTALHVDDDSGSSVITARPIASDFSADPQVRVVVTPREPANDAPMAAPTPAISSSAWRS